MAQRDESLRKLSDPILHERIGFKETTVRKLIKEGSLKSTVVRGVLLVPDSAIDEFVSRAKHGRVAY